MEFVKAYLLCVIKQDVTKCSHCAPSRNCIYGYDICGFTSSLSKLCGCKSPHSHATISTPEIKRIPQQTYQSAKFTDPMFLWQISKPKKSPPSSFHTLKKKTP